MLRCTNWVKSPNVVCAFTQFVKDVFDKLRKTYKLSLSATEKNAVCFVDKLRKIAYLVCAFTQFVRHALDKLRKTRKLSLSFYTVCL